LQALQTNFKDISFDANQLHYKQWHGNVFWTGGGEAENIK